MIDKQDAIARLDALDKKSDALESTRRELAEESKKLRAIIEAEPKKEPRGLCWVWNHAYYGKGHIDVAVIVDHNHACGYLDRVGKSWVHAVPLIDAELQEYRGRWE